MGNLVANIRQLSANADRIVELWDSPKEQKTCAAGIRQAEADMDPPDSTEGSALSFDRVSFGYTQETNVIGDISFSVTPGAFVALVGESGCGKSTVMKLAASLYSPQEGSVRILGRDISGWDLDSLRSRIAYVTQDTYLFPGSLRDNICAGSMTHRNDENEALLEACIEAAQLSAFVKFLPAGLDTDAGERGVFLSGGQRQRISIARALYKRADLLFLDEATSGLDRSTEEAVLQGIMRMPDILMPGTMNVKPPTLLAITHSLANVRNADLLIVFKDGRIAETGTHETLLAREGEYCRLLACQREEVSF
jgi:ABC-type multidrug transport system fused ATPase/permease subunit